MNTITILFIITSHAFIGTSAHPTGVWFEELTTPYYVFKDAGYNVEIISVRGGEIPIDPGSKKPLGDNPHSVDRFLKDQDAMHMIATTKSIHDIDPKNYAVVFFPGGHGTMWDLPNNKDISNIINTTLEDHKIVAAVCHGPAAFVGVKDRDGQYVVSGKNLSSFTNSEEKAAGLDDEMPFALETQLIEQGAIFKRADDFQSFSITDGQIVTGQNPASSEMVARNVITLLEKQSQ